MRIPCVLAGEEIHHNQAKATGGHRALQFIQGPHASGNYASGRPLGRALHAMVWVLGGLSGGQDNDRWLAALYSLEIEEGTLITVLAIRAGTLFTYLDPELTIAGPLPSTNNRIEGMNLQLRAMLRNHRGRSSLKRVKAVFWWCHMYSGDTRSTSGLLATMSTDVDIDLLFTLYSSSLKREDCGPE